MKYGKKDFNGTAKFMVALLITAGGTMALGIDLKFHHVFTIWVGYMIGSCIWDYFNPPEDDTVEDWVWEAIHEKIQRDKQLPDK